MPSKNENKDAQGDKGEMEGLRRGYLSVGEDALVD
jgi:hypothetical protein